MSGICRCNYTLAYKLIVLIFHFIQLTRQQHRRYIITQAVNAR